MDIIKKMVPTIIQQLKNDKDQTYSVVVACDNPGKFIRELWESMPDRYHGCPQTDEEACSEWTDRIRDYRTTVNSEGAYIRTHAWSADGDKHELHIDILKFLRSHGLPI